MVIASLLEKSLQALAKGCPFLLIVNACPCVTLVHLAALGNHPPKPMEHLKCSFP